MAIDNSLAPYAPPGWKRPNAPYRSLLKQQRWDITPAEVISTVMLILLQLRYSTTTSTWLKIWEGYSFKAINLQSWLDERQDDIIRTCHESFLRSSSLPQCIILSNGAIIWKDRCNQSSLTSTAAGRRKLTFPDSSSDRSGCFSSTSSTSSPTSSDSESSLSLTPTSPVNSESSPDSLTPAPFPFCIPEIVVTPPEDEPIPWEDTQIPVQCTFGGFYMVVPGKRVYDIDLEDFEDSAFGCTDDEDEEIECFSPPPHCDGHPKSFWIDDDEDELPDLSDF